MEPLMFGLMVLVVLLSCLAGMFLTTKVLLWRQQSKPTRVFRKYYETAYEREQRLRLNGGIIKKRLPSRLAHELEALDRMEKNPEEEAAIEKARWLL